jgi:hypothetical protein
MLRELLNQLKAAGHTARSVSEGLIFTVGNITIAFGQDDDGLSAYIQTDLPAGPSHSTAEGLTVAAAVQLCQQQAQAAVQGVA